MGLLSMFNKKKETKINFKANSLLSFVLLDECEGLNQNGLLKKYNEICDKKFKATDIEIKDNTVTFTIDGNLGFISLMPAPFPWSDLEGPCQTSWMWREAEKELQNHKQHIIVSWMGQNRSGIMISKIVSQITASVLEDVNGLGVYWGGACLVNKKEVFCGMVYEIEESGLPLFLWIDFRIEQHPSGELNLITYGLKNYNVMEIEIIKSTKTFETLIDFTLNISRYLIENGNVISDGDTLGEDENQKIIAWHRPSVWTEDDRGDVLRLEY